MQTFVTGYQYGDRKQFLGQYVFETHGEFEPHLPPNTVLDAPPKSIPAGKEAIWENGAWKLQNIAPPPEAPQVKTVRTDEPIPVIQVKEVPLMTEEELKAFAETHTPLINTEPTE